MDTLNTMRFLPGVLRDFLLVIASAKTAMRGVYLYISDKEIGCCKCSMNYPYARWTTLESAALCCIPCSLPILSLLDEPTSERQDAQPGAR